MSKKHEMSDQRLHEIIASFGAAPKRWPEAERDAALALLEQGNAASAVDQGQALDQLLDSISAPAPSELLQARILKQAKADRLVTRIISASTPRPQRQNLPFRAIAATLAITLGVGIGVEQFFPSNSQSYRDDYQLAMDLYDEDDLDFVEILQ